MVFYWSSIGHNILRLIMYILLYPVWAVKVTLSWLKLCLSQSSQKKEKFIRKSHCWLCMLWGWCLGPYACGKGGKCGVTFFMGPILSIVPIREKIILNFYQISIHVSHYSTSQMHSYCDCGDAKTVIRIISFATDLT